MHLAGQAHAVAVLPDDDLVESFDLTEEELAGSVLLPEAVNVKIDGTVPHGDHDLVPAAVTPCAGGLDLPAHTRPADAGVGDPLRPDRHDELLASEPAGCEEGSLLHTASHPEAQPEGTVPRISEAGDVVGAQSVRGELDQRLGTP